MLNKPKKIKELFKLVLCIKIVIVTLHSCSCQHDITNISIPSSNFKPIISQIEKTYKPEIISPDVQIKPETKIVQALMPTKLHQLEHKNIQFNVVTFDTRNHQLTVADQPDGPGSLWTNAKSVAKAKNGIAAINAGFFTPEGKPLGIVISNGKKQGANNASSLGTGLFYHTPNGAKISRRIEWSKLYHKPPAHLLQSGPMLLEHSNPIAGLSNKSSRPRSFLATDGKNHWCIGHADSCTLSQLSNALTSLKINGFKPTTALNLDGGRSSDLWVSSSITGGEKEIRPFWNKPVRNFLILK